MSNDKSIWQFSGSDRSLGDPTGPVGNNPVAKEFGK
jgi:hypothetical protein